VNAQYLIVYKDETNLILIKDIGHRDGLSITNDVHRIVKELFETQELTHQRLLYIDSLNRCDEIVHENGAFKCFKAFTKR